MPKVDYENIPDLNDWSMRPTQRIIYNLMQPEINREYHKRLAADMEALSRGNPDECYPEHIVAGMAWRFVMGKYSKLGVEKFALDALTEITKLSAGDFESAGKKKLTNLLTAIHTTAQKFAVME